MMRLLVVALFAISAFGQQVGHQKQESHLPLSLGVCSSSGNCQKQQKGVVMDSNWRWVHKNNDWHNCFTDGEWDSDSCPDGPTCAQNCAVDGIPENDWRNTYGVSSTGDALRLNYVTQGQYSLNVGSRVYMLDGEEGYEMFKLKNQEFTFDIDVSQMPCGVNAALYLVEMDKDGGAHYSGNKAGAKYGTGYCDAQCPHDIKWINGEANCEEYTKDYGKYGTCCAEMDIWEGNSVSSAVTVHDCKIAGQHRCHGTECGDNKAHERYQGECDKDGCDYNGYRMGDKDFYGKGSQYKVDTSQKFTVVTQFLTHNGENGGDLVEIKRKFVQNGKVIEQSESKVPGLSGNSLTDEFCTAQKKAFGDNDQFTATGGMKAMGDALERGMALVISIWDDVSDYMLWLDSCDPADADPDKAGVCRGSCPTSSGRPDQTRSQYPHSYVSYSNIKIGPIGSTFPNYANEETFMQ